MKELIVKEKHFIYGGEMYSLDCDLRISTGTYYVNPETDEEYCSCKLDEIPEGTLIKVKHKYSVEKGWSTIDTFDTKEEAEELISKIVEQTK